MALCKLILVIFFAILTKITFLGSHAAEYYPDLTTQNGSSCTEKTAFATSSDPFYQWITLSYLVEGFETDRNITIQQAGSAYKKLSAWRVAGKARMFNSPEPHVVGGSFHQKEKNIIARMVVNWGMSIRICIGDFGDKGPNMCRYTFQIIAVKEDTEDTKMNFRVLLSEVNYNNSQMVYLVNWVSNAKVPGAVGEDRKIVEKNKNVWYYSRASPWSACNNQHILYYRADMAAFLGKSFVECTCVGNVCAQSLDMTAEDGEFKDAVPCKDQTVKSYWIPTTEGVNLYSYSSKFDSFFYVNSMLDTFPDNITKGRVEAMQNFSSCFEGWLAKQTVAPLTNSSFPVTACDFNLVIPHARLYANPVLALATDMSVVYSSVDEALASGDECVETDTVEEVCSSDILTHEGIVIEEIKNIIANLTQTEEVRDFANTKWDDMKPKRHDLYLDILTAFFAAFTAGWAVSSETLVKLERFIVRWLSKIKRGQCVVASEEAQLPASNQASKEEDSKTVFYIRFCLRFVALGGVMVPFMYRSWKALSDLKSDPLPAWSKTVEYQKEGMAFLVTTTSTYQVKPIWKTMFILGFILVPYFVLVIFLNFKRLEKRPLSSPTKTTQVRAMQMTDNHLSN